jgi:signal transduction histidine kinase
VETTAANISFAEHSRTSRFVRGLGLAIAVGTGYFLIDWVALGLWIEPHKESVFSFTPGGFASGLLIALGPRARWPVSAGVGVAAYAALVLLSEARPIGINVSYAIGDIVQVLIIAGLIDHFFGRGFSLERLHHVLGLVAAAAFSCAVCSAGWALFIILFYIPEGQILIFFQHLFLNTLSGVVSIAPLVIGVGAIQRQLPPMGQFLEAAVAIGALAVMTGAIVLLPADLWETVVPAALLFPILVWLAVRCQPVFAAAGVFLASMTIIATTTYHIGHFGQTTLSSEDRILQAQTIIMFVAVGTCVLAALFAERKESEARLTESNMLLERERDNKLMNVQAALAAVAHEIKQPLAAISAGSSAALRWLKRMPPDYEEAIACLTGMMEASGRANEVLDSTRGLFKTAAQQKTTIEINRLVQQVLRVVENDLRVQGVTVSTELQEDLPQIMGDRTLLQQAIINLVKNAVEAMGTVPTTIKTLRLVTTQDGNSVVSLSVQDSGPGINPETGDHVFDPFFTTKSSGTGLGLSISRKIIEDHGGDLRLTETSSNGSTFEITLPSVATSDSGGPTRTIAAAGAGI